MKLKSKPKKRPEGLNIILASGTQYKTDKNGSFRRLTPKPVKKKLRARAKRVTAKCSQ